MELCILSLTIILVLAYIIKRYGKKESVEDIHKRMEAMERGAGTDEEYEKLMKRLQDVLNDGEDE